MNTKLHAVTDADGRPIRVFMTAGQDSDHTGAAVLLSGLPKADWLLADRGYDADWFRDALKDKGIRPYLAAKSREFVDRGVDALVISDSPGVMRPERAFSALSAVRQAIGRTELHFHCHTSGGLAHEA